MIVVFTAIQVAVAVIGGVLCLVLGMVKKAPNDLSMGAVAVVELLLVAQLVVSLMAPALGNPSQGSAAEFYTYVISALIVPPAAAFWALVDRTRWATMILGAACLTVAVMVYRMQQIWLG